MKIISRLLFATFAFLAVPTTAYAKPAVQILLAGGADEIYHGADVSDVVTMTLFDARGREVARQTAQNIEDGQVTMNVANQPSGMYLLWVRTAEGSAMRKVAICH